MIESEITSIKWFNQFTNDTSLVSNDTDITPNFVANVGEVVRADIEIALRVIKLANGETWEVGPTGSNSYLKAESTDFREEGFEVGDRLRIKLDYDPVTPDTFDTDTNIILDISPDGTVLTLSESAAQIDTYDNMAVWMSPNSHTENTFSGLIVEFGLIENDEQYNNLSKVSGNPQGYYGTVSTGSSLTGLTALGIPNDWDSMETFNNMSASLNSGTIRIVQHFIVVPGPLAGNESGIINLVPPEYFTSQKCLKHAFNVTLKPSITSNRELQATFEDERGFTGWYGENFNGLDSIDKIESVSYTDDATGDPVDGLQQNARTNFEIRISTETGSFSNGDVVMTYVEKVPQRSEQYTNTDTTYWENFVYRVVRTEVGSGSTDAGWRSNEIQASAVLDGSQIVVTGSVNYGVSTQQIFEEGDQYLLRVSVHRSGNTSETSTRSMLIADLRDYAAAPLITGLATISELQLLYHEQDPASDVGSNIATVWNEDSLTAKGSVTLDLDQSTILQSLVFELISTDGDEKIVLDTVTIDTSEALVVQGVQQIDESVDRNYLLPASNPHNKIIVETGTGDASSQTYNFRASFKVSWQDWIANNTVPADDFFDASQPLNNRNFKSSNYSDEESYQVYYRVSANTFGVSPVSNRTGDGLDVKDSGVITVLNYGESDDGEITAGIIETFDPDTGANTNLQLLSNKNTLMRVTWDAQSAEGANSQYIHRIETSGDTSRQIEESSKKYGPVPGGLLGPVTFENIPAGSKTECLVYGNKLTSGVNYNLSAHLNANVFRFPELNGLYVDNFNTSSGRGVGTAQRVGFRQQGFGNPVFEGPDFELNGTKNRNITMLFAGRAYKNGTIYCQHSNGGKGVQISAIGPNIVFRIFSNTVTTNNVLTPITFGEDIFIAVVVDGDNVQGYLNGIAAGSFTFPFSPDNVQPGSRDMITDTIGTGFGIDTIANNRTTTLYKHLSIWPVSLTAQEVFDLCSNPAPVFGPYSATNYYDFDQAPGTDIVPDIAGSKDGKLVNIDVNTAWREADETIKV
ncbi:MAG: hypothetical protein HRU12_08355 [Phaeodactylibacter sp.]|nr:hypothetical protein [Phaeodactylibacter sp.]